LTDGTEPKVKKTRRKTEKDEIRQKGKLEETLKLRFGSKMEFVGAEIENHPELATDTKLLNNLLKIFGIKRFYKMQGDIKAWATRIQKKGKDYACKDCGRTYGTELGCKYHVRGKCPQNIQQYRCELCPYEILETAKMECK